MKKIISITNRHIPDQFDEEDIGVIEEKEIDVEDIISLQNHLIIWNDNVNSFAFVIKTLMEVCKHTREQANQCSLIIHNNGKCSVKQGSYRKLKPMCETILDKNIKATIE